MDRRAFIATIGLTVLGEPIAAPAQQPTKMARIGFLVTASIGSPEFRATVDPFRQGLRDLGYVEGRDLIIEYRSADGNQARFPSLANDLVRLNVDLILAGSTPHARAAQQATRTIPIVVAVMGDPVADGLVASLARPGGNITGMRNLGVGASRPSAWTCSSSRFQASTRVTILWHPGAVSEATTSHVERSGGRGPVVGNGGSTVRVRRRGSTRQRLLRRDERSAPAPCSCFQVRCSSPSEAASSNSS